MLFDFALHAAEVKISREINTNSLYTLININIFIKKTCSVSVCAVLFCVQINCSYVCFMKKNVYLCIANERGVFWF